MGRLSNELSDLYLVQGSDFPMEQADLGLEDLVRAGKMRWYVWSTDDLERARFFAKGVHWAVIEYTWVP